MRLHKLIKRYRTDPISTFQKLRHASRLHYENMLDRIDDRYGRTKLEKITARTLLTWYEEWSAGGRVAYGQDFVRRLRTVVRFGAAMLEKPEASRIAMLLSMMRFKGGKPRTETLNADQVVAVRAKAHEIGLHSLALEQAFQFELTLRQKDVIGEFLPLSEPIDSDVVVGDQKWARGLRWEEIDDDFVLRHTTSKKLKDIEVDIKLSPMVVEELARLAGVTVRSLRRRMLPASGPVIIFEGTTRPWRSSWFRRTWRRVADVAGVPKNVHNMDTRAGAITEAINAGADMDEVRQTATHSDLSMTQRYNRGSYLARSSDVARCRAESRTVH
jgi:hypothetical protein